MGASNAAVVADWLHAHSTEYTSRRQMRDACAVATGRSVSHCQTCISAMMTAGKLPWLPPETNTTLAAGYTDAPAHATAPQAVHADMLPVAAPGMPGAPLTEDALRSRIDVHHKARRFLESIEPGTFYRLDDAAVAAGIPRGNASAVFGDPRYEAYRGQAAADQRVYIGHPSRIAALKQERILR